MNTTKEILHAALLKIMDTNRTRFGLQAATLSLQLRGEAIVADKEEVTEALDYLGSRNPPLVHETRPQIDRELRAWKITTAGILYADEHGL
jgi:hypothetical protein